MNPLRISIATFVAVIFLAIVTKYQTKVGRAHSFAFTEGAVTLPADALKKEDPVHRGSKLPGETVNTEPRDSLADLVSQVNKLRNGEISSEAILKVRVLIAMLDPSDFGRSLELASTIDSPLLRKEFVFALWERSKILGGRYVEDMLEAYPGFAESHWNGDAAIAFSRENFKVGIDYANLHLSGDEYRQTIAEIFGQRAIIDPEEAASSLKLLEFGPAKDLAVKMIAIEWSKRNLDQSILWAEKLEDSEERINAFSGISHQWGFTDPQGSLAYATRLPPGAGERGAILNNSLAQWSGYSPLDALEWLRFQDLTEEESVNSTKVILRVWASSEPAKVFAYLSENDELNLTSKAFLDEATGMFIQWANRDPEAAVKASLEIPNPRFSANAFSTAYSSWVRSSPIEAARWIDPMPTGTTKDHAIGILIPQIKETGVKLAWAEKVGSADRRREICIRIVGGESPESIVEILNSKEIRFRDSFKAEIANLLVSVQK